MKHILLIHQAFVSPRQSGGTRHYEFARILVSDGNSKFTIVASTLSYHTGQEVQPEDDNDLEQEINIIRAYTLPVTHRSFVWRVIAFFSFMISSVWASRKAKDVDLVMGTTPPIFQSVSAWFISFVRRKPFLLEVRDLWPEFAIDMGVLTNPLLIRLSRLLESFLYNRANHILVNSPAYRDYMLNRGIPEDKVTLIPNGVDSQMFDLAADGIPIRRQYGLQNKFVIAYTGALGLANDIGTILQTAQRLQDKPQIHFLLVGDGKERANLEAIAEEYNLKNVTFTGALQKADIPDILAASDVCIATLMNIPMFKTTYPNKVFDYMAAGKPTLLGIDGVIRDVVEAAGGGIFIPPGDDEAMASAILQLYKDRSRSAEMGRSAREYVETYFDRHKHADQFAELLEKVINKG
jgi:glycosyltransferase involved in cell wall biosynthesis